MPKLIIVIGLPGSGKSYYLKKLQKDKEVNCFFDDYHGNAINDSTEVIHSRHFGTLISRLANDEDCAVSDIEFCEESRRKAIETEIKRLFPLVEIERHFFSNEPEKCEKNIKIRASRSYAQELCKIKKLKDVYKIPKNVKVIQVHDPSTNLKNKNNRKH